MTQDWPEKTRAGQYPISGNGAVRNPEGIKNVKCSDLRAHIRFGGKTAGIADDLGPFDGSYGRVRPPASVALVEFTLRRGNYRAFGDHMEEFKQAPDVALLEARTVNAVTSLSDPNRQANCAWGAVQ